MKNLHKNLLFWYEKNGRKNLPWRNLQGDKQRAFKVYISEIMLQQTQVSRVLEHFYFPFLQKFSDLKALANADENELLKAWQGLGYYSRARNLKKSALICCEKYGENLPDEVLLLKNLPGVGAYTAGAIACFGYDKAVSFVDSNIKRIISRFYALKNPSQKELEALALKFLNKKEAFNHNQALIDLGALLCVAKSPKCELCPLNSQCKGQENPSLYSQSKKQGYENLHLNFIIALKGSKIALAKSEERLFKGLYNLPKLEEFQSRKCEFLGKFKHSYTKYKLDISLFKAHIKGQNYPKNVEFFSFKEALLLPLSNLSFKALKLYEAKCEI